MSNQPIIVPASPLVPVVATLVRQALVILGGILMSRGVIAEDTLNTILAAIPVLIGAVWSIYAAVDKQQKSRAMARLLPDSIAQEK